MRWNISMTIIPPTDEFCQLTLRLRGNFVQHVLTFDLSFHELQEFPIALNHVEFDLVRRDLLEELPSTVDLTFLDFSQLHRRHRAFGFGYEVNVLHGTFLECDRPIGKKQRRHSTLLRVLTAVTAKTKRRQAPRTEPLPFLKIRDDRICTCGIYVSNEAI